MTLVSGLQQTVFSNGIGNGPLLFGTMVRSINSIGAMKEFSVKLTPVPLAQENRELLVELDVDRSILSKTHIGLTKENLSFFGKPLVVVGVYLERENYDGDQEVFY